ncbi:hypothetical protein CI102_4349 [Trichoderma harzianum]|nr:hypothetical protein CI102_4349 [Trichoderma harzianum]
MRFGSLNMFPIPPVGSSPPPVSDSVLAMFYILVLLCVLVSAIRRTCFGLHGLFNRGQATLELCVAWVMLETGLVRIVCSEQISLAVKSSAFASPALGPVWLDLGRLFGVLQRIVPVLLGGICGRSVGVENVVFGLKSDGLGELVAVCKQSKNVNVSLWIGSLECDDEGRGTEGSGGVIGSASKQVETYIASSKFFSAMALLPRALSSSAEAMVNSRTVYKRQ